jgi:hypothetical protein
MKDQCRPIVDHQRRLTHAMREVVKKEVIKLLDAGIIYPIPHRECEPGTLCIEERRLTMVKNEKNELIPQRIVTGWQMCIDYRKLNKAMKKYHFPLLFTDERLERLANHAYFCFLDGYSGFMQIPITRVINTRQCLFALMECLHIEGCPSVYATLQPLFNVT